MRVLYIIILITISPFFLYSQSVTYTGNQFNLGFKLGYFYPTKTSFQNFYSQSIGDFPLSSITVELEYDYKQDLHLFVETKIIHNELENYSDRRLFIIPTFFGFKYIQENSENSNFFAGLGAGFYWIQMIFGNVLEVDDYGNELKVHDIFYKSYYGIGIKPFIGFDFQMFETSRFGIQFDYDISHVGSVENGGLGDTGGLLTNIFINFDL